MAIARITRRQRTTLTDGVVIDQDVSAEVEVRDSYPDALDQAVTEVARLWCLVPEDDDEAELEGESEA